MASFDSLVSDFDEDLGCKELVFKWDPLNTSTLESLSKIEPIDGLQMAEETLKKKRKRKDKTRSVKYSEETTVVNDSQPMQQNTKNRNEKPRKIRKIKENKTLKRYVEEAIDTSPIVQVNTKDIKESELVETLLNEIVSWESEANEYIENQSNPEAYRNAINEIKKKIAEIDQLNSDDDTFENLKNKGGYKDKNSIFATYIKTYLCQLKEKSLKLKEKELNNLAKLSH